MRGTNTIPEISLLSEDKEKKHKNPKHNDKVCECMFKNLFENLLVVLSDLLSLRIRSGWNDANDSSLVGAESLHRRVQCLTVFVHVEI